MAGRSSAWRCELLKAPRHRVVVKGRTVAQGARSVRYTEVGSSLLRKEKGLDCAG